MKTEDKRKFYFTFGQQHTHRVNNITLDKDIVAVIYAPDEEEARDLAFSWFGDKFATSYNQEAWLKIGSSLFPRGYAYLNL